MFAFIMSFVSLDSFIKFTKSFDEIASLFILATLFVLPPLKTLPMPQNTNGIIIIPTSIPANFEFEKPLNLLIIFYCLYLLI